VTASARAKSGGWSLTLGDETTEEEIDYVLRTLPEVAKKLRFMSPLWKGPVE
jgi:cysteine desulfurase